MNIKCQCFLSDREGGMGSLKCPLCCRAEFPTRRALQQHLLDVLDLLKCPTCAKSFTSILGLVQHLSLSSCNVEVGVNFDEHFVTYVDCSFMKKDKPDSKTIAQPVKSQARTEPAKPKVHVSLKKNIYTSPGIYPFIFHTKRIVKQILVCIVCKCIPV